MDSSKKTRNNAFGCSSGSRPAIQRHTRNRLGALALLAAASTTLGASSAMAQVQVYTNSAAWNAAAGLVRTDTLANDAPGNHLTPYSTAGGWNLSSLAGALTIQVFDGVQGVNGTRYMHFRDFGAQVQFASAAGPQNAVSFSYRTSFEAWQVKVGGQVVATLPSNTNGFIGLTSPTPMASFVLTSPSNTQGGISVDNIARPERAYGQLHNDCVAFMMQNFPLQPNQPVTRAQMEQMISQCSDFLASSGFDPAVCTDAVPRVTQSLVRSGYFYVEGSIEYYGTPVISDQVMTNALDEALTGGLISLQVHDAILGLDTIIRQTTTDMTAARDYAQNTLINGTWSGNDRLFADIAGGTCEASFTYWTDNGPNRQFKLPKWVKADIGGFVGGVSKSLIGGGSIGDAALDGAISGAVASIVSALSIAAAPAPTGSDNWENMPIDRQGTAFLDIGQGRLEVAHIGGTGQDGVEWNVAGRDSASLSWVPIPEICDTLPGARLFLNASFAASPPIDGGTTIECLVFNDWWVIPDLSTPTYLIQVVQNGQVIASYPNHTGMAAGTDLWPIGFGAQAVAENGQSSIVLKYPPGTQITIGSTILFGDELRMFAEAPRPLAQSINSIRVTASGVPSMEFTQLLRGLPSCPCDWNSDGLLNSQDFFDFINALFAGDADYNNDGNTNSQDFFDFINCFFTGCP